ncbi:MAG: hypothetical protein ACR2PB_07395 [Desulfocapsaceae bacterium]
MNHHYIDYMIRQRQLEEIEDCERRRMLRAGGYDNNVMIHRIASKLNGLVSGVIGFHGKRRRILPIGFALINSVVPKRGEEV